MLTIIPLLTLLLFSVTYPLCFWLSARDPLKNNFHHFHIGLPNLTAGLSVVGLFMIGVKPFILHFALVWLILFFLVSFLSWSRPTVHPAGVTLVSLLGLWVYGLAHLHLLDGAIFPSLMVNVLAALILSAAFYAMNLGHWYLNVHGLPLSHLKRATMALGVLLGLRFVWNVIYGLRARVMMQGEEISIASFVGHLEGIFLVVAMFFGTVFPLVSIYFVWGTLQAKSTQSATGILYVLLSSILIGDLAYKFYLLHYHLAF